ncbi:MAG: hypothetical protein KME23_11480 [Goleter apudmare HA4340-LM2]|jgi:hypothetical protein|nr:hypothetical protein [Goleter apudmare HA4340-LM2]
MKLNAVISNASLATLMIGLGGARASAQITIQSTGTLSGTIQLPSFNPNFNRVDTVIDTDSQGIYSRNIGSRNNPNLVPVYQSEYVRVQTRSDGSLSYSVYFKGIPVVSFDGVLTSPVLTGGELGTYAYQGKLPGTKFEGIVQDEFGLAKGLYTGIVTDPKTGQQYQGTFEVSGQGPRYSDRNGGDSPTVFDFKSDIPGSPTIKSFTMKDTPLVRLTIKVPANATLVTPNENAMTPTPAPIVNSGNTPPAPVVGNNSTPTLAPVVGNNSTPTPAPIADADSVISSLPSTANKGESNSLVLSTQPNIEFSSGKVNFVIEPALISTAICSQDAANCPHKPTVSKQVIGPRSRVLLR